MASSTIPAAEAREHHILAADDDKQTLDSELPSPAKLDPQETSCENYIEPSTSSPTADSTNEAVEVEAKAGQPETAEDWAVLACVFLSNILAGVETTAISALYADLARHYAASYAAVGWCTGIQCFTAALASILVSYPIKTYGCRITAIFGALLYALGIGFSAFAPNLLVIYCTYGLLAGFGSSFNLLSCIIILQQRFTRHAALANGLSAVGYSLGSMAGGQLTSLLLDRFALVGTFLMLGAIQANRIPLAVCFWAPRPARSRRRAETQISENSVNKHSTAKESLMNHHLTTANHCQKNRIDRCGDCKAAFGGILRYLADVVDFTILRRLPFSLFLVICCLLYFTLGFWPHVPGRAVQGGLLRDQGVWAVSSMSFTSLVVKLLITVVSGWRDVNRLLVFTFGLFAGLLSMVAIVVVPGLAGLFLSTALFGVTLGSTHSINAVVVRDLVGLKLLPRCIALQYFFTGFFRLGGAPFVGWIFDLTGSYDIGFAVYGALLLVATILMTILYFLDRNMKLQQKQLERDHQ